MRVRARFFFLIEKKKNTSSIIVGRRNVLFSIIPRSSFLVINFTVLKEMWNTDDDTFTN